MVNPDTVENINYFVRHSYWMFYLGDAVGIVKGLLLAVGFWRLHVWLNRSAATE